MTVQILGADGLPIRGADAKELVTRRTVLKSFGLLAGALSLPAWSNEAPERANDFWLRPRQLNLVHASGDRLRVTYWSDGQIIQPSYEEVSWFMRDRVDHKAVYMHPVLLDILYGICGWLDYFGIRDPLVLNSGYRTRSRNSTIEGAAQNSQHPLGGAGDVRHPSVSSAQMSKVGVWLGGGGVGWYPSKNFTHVDRGRLRTWRG